MGRWRTLFFFSNYESGLHYNKIQLPSDIGKISAIELINYTAIDEGASGIVVVGSETTAGSGEATAAHYEAPLRIKELPSGIGMLSADPSMHDAFYTLHFPRTPNAPPINYQVSFTPRHFSSLKIESLSPSTGQQPRVTLLVRVYEEGC